MSRPTQPALFRAPAEPRPLTDRQACALEVLRRAGGDGLDAEAVGAELCARSGKHPAGDRCRFDRSNGVAVLRALRAKGHAKSRRDGTWYALAGGTVEATGSFGEFPEGF